MERAKHNLTENVLAPLLRRLGAIGAGYLVGLGADVEIANAAAAALVALGLLAADLAASYKRKVK